MVFCVLDFELLMTDRLSFGILDYSYSNFGIQSRPSDTLYNNG